MLVRIVKMHFRPAEVPRFLQLFAESRQTIASFEGCLHLELWQDSANPDVFFTHSRWQNEAALNAYRHSEFFKQTWAKTKALFQEPAHAWSVKVHTV
ncbi:antibiotic biosynthesis monooxygenase [Sphingobacteriales bacterium UPWRP_1]|nr:antibiotic biosynthesis monooxygenase [Sphingobacteriales bacterium TSM_CSM]PSJ77972.1 antibiotic biosynthesis monooxygenase [Sphingobacteriales bacterium UPWRP_1]